MVNEYRLKVFERYEKELEEKIATLKDELEQKPVSDFIATQREFAQLLENYPGKSRLTKEFNQKFQVLHQREQKAKAGVKKYNFEYMEKVSDELIKLQSELGEIKRELYFIKNS